MEFKGVHAKIAFPNYYQYENMVQKSINVSVKILLCIFWSVRLDRYKLRNSL